MSTKVNCLRGQMADVYVGGDLYQERGGRKSVWSEDQDGRIIITRDRLPGNHCSYPVWNQISNLIYSNLSTYVNIMSLAQSSASSQPITIILLLPKLNQTATVSQRYPLNITTYIMAFWESSLKYLFCYPGIRTCSKTPLIINLVYSLFNFMLRSH